ncbi:hypothetical protein TrRE_jg10905 [Triparma retinervis]|uniref:Major facilitator superfamily (MFS) profile domain-containing protein n=1 Tax=Triparma retinervis TaxID=2557542 RepID=A0A9W6ZHH2_9STRA|nr:hypothetical protein TrRE_jg10905 [Triparma retinervis]
MPFYQSRRDAFSCDATCYGRYTSLRSFLSLLGSFLCGRLSDRYGRAPLLHLGVLATLLGLALSWAAQDVRGLYLAMVPGALLQNNFAVVKALFADYYSAPSEARGLDGEVAGLVGKLGMSVGISFMLGPMIGGMFVSTFSAGALVAAVLTSLSWACVIMIPPPPNPKGPQNQTPKGGHTFLDLTPLRSPGPRVVLLLRMLMSLAFHTFMTPWTPSLKERFDFGPKQHGTFMSFVGLVYALSQGFAAKAVVRAVGRSDLILVSCSVFLSLGRVVAMGTDRLEVVYGCFFLIIISLGVTNTVISAALNGLAPPEKIGGLIGLVGSFESLAGMVGPMVGGKVFELGGKEGTLAVVCACYVGVAGTAWVGWRKWVEGGMREGKVKTT